MTSTDLVWFRGAVRASDEALVRVDSEVVLRGANVFEGIRAYWNDVGGLGVLGLDEHLRRLRQSARLLAIDHGLDDDAVRSAIWATVEANGASRGADLYIRPSIGILSGRLGTDERYEWYDAVSVVRVPRRDLGASATAIVSRWSRAVTPSMPSQAKAGGAYLGFRLPIVERSERGADAVIVLNESRRVAEAEGAAVVVIVDDALVSPPTREGGLASITRDIVRDLARDAGIPFAERPVPAELLHEADGVFLCGTLVELQPLATIDDHPIATLASPAYRELSGRFDALRSARRPSAWLAPIEASAGVRR